MALRRSKFFFFLVANLSFKFRRPGHGSNFPFLSHGQEFFALDHSIINNSNSFVDPLLLQREAIGGQPESAPFLPDFNFGLFAHANAIQQSPPTLPQPAPTHSVLCTQPGCTRTFTRDSDRIRHNNTVHGAIQAVHLCPIAGCPKSQGVGYSRADKVIEHKWKKHANLGYTKRVL